MASEDAPDVEILLAEPRQPAGLAPAGGSPGSGPGHLLPGVRGAGRMAAALAHCEDCWVRSECATLNQSPSPPDTVEESTILAIRLSIAEILEELVFVARGGHIIRA